jgi:hypothetical protein
MNKHSYLLGCPCKRCVKELARRTAQATASGPPRNSRRRSRPRPDQVTARFIPDSDPLDQGDNLGESPDY